VEIFLKRYENDEKVFEALSSCIRVFIEKYRAFTIAESIKKLHEGGSPMSANIARKLVNLFHLSPKETSSPDILSNRENEILQLLAKGLLYKEIADQPQISTGTVRQHIHKILRKASCSKQNRGY
jgi:DNA-binding NarL/FixJ family response regulator